MKPGKDGVYKLSLDDPRLQEAKDRYEVTRKQKNLPCLPSILAEAKWGGEVTLNKALALGQCWYKAGTNQMEIEWKEGLQQEEKGGGTKWTADHEKCLGSHANFEEATRVLEGMNLDFDGSGAASGSGADLVLANSSAASAAERGVPKLVIDACSQCQAKSIALVKNCERILVKLESNTKLSPRAQTSVENLSQHIEDATDAERAVTRALRLKKNLDGSMLTTSDVRELIARLGENTQSLAEAFSVAKMHLSETP